LKANLYKKPELEKEERGLNVIVVEKLIMRSSGASYDGKAGLTA